MSSEINLTVGNGGHCELPSSARVITGEVLFAVVQLMGQVMGVIGAQNCGRAPVIPVILRGPDNPILVAVGRNGQQGGGEIEGGDRLRLRSQRNQSRLGIKME